MIPRVRSALGRLGRLGLDDLVCDFLVVLCCLRRSADRIAAHLLADHHRGHQQHPQPGRQAELGSNLEFPVEHGEFPQLGVAAAGGDI